MRIYLADLTHTGSVFSSNIFPLAIGLLASYLKKHLDFEVEIELFKNPAELNERLTNAKPDIVGFSNYSWNEQISLAFARRIKECYPETVTVFGGPNYGLEEEEVQAYWSKDPAVDFYIVKEGEEAMLRLVNTLLEHDKNPELIKQKGLHLDNCHYSHNGEIVKGEMIKRIRIEDIPSPYLEGYMDKFFDQGLLPMIHTTRGCPFSCSFCTEGNAYYNKVSQRQETLSDELNYIAKKITHQQSLYISDANFGMFRHDVDKAKMIQQIQKDYDYPNSVVVSTGKNQKERVLSIAEMLNGSLNLAASVQSTNVTVLENVKRNNINLAGLTEVGAQAVDNDTGTYTEIILALPGDTKEAHFGSLKDTIDAGFDIIRMYQLILLPQTELNTPASRQEHSMTSLYRIMPRSFGKYPILGEEQIVAESEQICIANSTLSIDDYLDCREMDLVVEIVHNGKIFEELYGLIRGLGLSWFDFLKSVFDKRATNTKFSGIMEKFRYENMEYLRETQAEIEEFVKDNLDALISEEMSTNEMSSAKAVAVFNEIEAVHQFVFQCAREYLSKNTSESDVFMQYLDELEVYSVNKKFNFYSDTQAKIDHRYNFDFIEIQANAFKVDFDNHVLDDDKAIAFCHTDKQKKSIDSLKKEYGVSLNGLSKMVMRQPYINRLFRNAEWA